MKKRLISVLILFNLTACSFDSGFQYLDTRATEKLEIPPDLVASPVNEEFQIPANFSSGLNETVNQVPVLAQVDSIRLAGSEDFYWLEIDGQVDNLYQTVKRFWSSEGYELEIDEPVIGIMQTKWILKEEGAVDQNAGFWASLFAADDLSASQDQYRTRFAREVDNNVTRIYIAHRGTEYKHRMATRQTEDEGPNDWTYRAPEPELEIEMLSRLMVFLGLDKASTVEQVAGIKLFAPRASIHTDNNENETYILVHNIKDITWNRLLHELDRLDIKIDSMNPSSGLSGDGVIYLKLADRMKSSGSSDDAQTAGRQIILVVSEESFKTTRISMENADGDVEDSSEAIEFLTMIYHHLR